MSRRLTSALVVVALWVASLAALAGPAAATQTTFVCGGTGASGNEGAAYVNEGAPNTNLGTDAELVTKDGGGTTKYAYVECIVSGLTGTVDSATLKLWPTSTSATATVKLFPLSPENTDFSESTVTWNTKPALGTKIDEHLGFTSGTPVEFNTGSQVTGNGTFRFGLARPVGETSPTTVSFASDEPTDTAQKPKLVVQSSAKKVYRKGFVATEGVSGIDDSHVDNVIWHVDWSALEPTDDGWSTTEFQNLKDDMANHSTWHFALRVYSGGQAPSWMKNAGSGYGPCVNVKNEASGITECVPRFWTSQYRTEWDELVEHVASELGSDSQFTDMINSACTTVFAELGILGNDTQSGIRLYNAGLTQSNYDSCVLNTFDDMVADLSPSGTRTSGAFHTNEQYPTSSGVSSAGWSAWRDNVINPVNTVHGDWVVTQNNSLSPDNDCTTTGQSLGSASDLYCWLNTRSIANTPTPAYGTGFQFGDTATHTRMVNAATNGVDMGGCFIERAVNDLESTLTSTELANFDADLEANCPN